MKMTYYFSNGVKKEREHNLESRINKVKGFLQRNLKVAGTILNGLIQKFSKNFLLSVGLIRELRAVGACWGHERHTHTRLALLGGTSATCLYKGPGHFLSISFRTSLSLSRIFWSVRFESLSCWSLIIADKCLLDLLFNQARLCFFVTLKP